MREVVGSILGISFDGLAISGIINEFLSVASIYRSQGLRVLLDVGGDIAHRPYAIDTTQIASWVKCVRSAGSVLPASYGAATVDEAAQLVSHGRPVTSIAHYMDICKELSAGVVATMERESVRMLLVENGTLPNNPLFTEALYLAIDEYGDRRSAGKYVLWRDHDLMWSSEPHLYGTYPFPGVRRPTASKYIHHCVATEWMRRRFEAWSGVSCHVMPNRFHVANAPSSTQGARPSLREAYGIPADAFLIARCTRVIAAKSIERDLRLVEALQRRLDDSSELRKIYLLVTGPTNEDPEEFRRLCDVAEALGIDRQVIWANGLAPFNAAFAAAAPTSAYSVGDLLAEANLSSFLTTYDYEGFGNPPGEAMAAGVPYISTAYELYHDVYGSKGAVAPLLKITQDSSAAEPIPDYFTEWVLRVLTDRDYRERMVERNGELCRRFFSLDALATQMQGLFGVQARVSV
jgi:glycosyltransferase involved in cell wall biosynthesis